MMDGFGASICRFFGMANLLMVWNLDVVSDIIADATNGGQAAEGTLGSISFPREKIILAILSIEIPTCLFPIAFLQFNPHKFPA
jgi:hypothetical protein